MKRLLFVSLLVVSVFSYGAAVHEECATDDAVSAQASALLKVAERLDGDGCPAPKASDYNSICGDIATKDKVEKEDVQFYEYVYEKRLWKISCADPKKDSEKVAKEKITKMWQKNQKNFKCDAVSFNVPNGNILKFSIAKSMPDFIDTLVSTYGLDINFVDPADKRNVLDYVRDEIEFLKRTSASQSSIDVYEKYLEILIDLGAKYSK